MSKYVDLDKVIDKLEDEWGYEGIWDVLYELPSASVVEVETLKKNIEANLDEAKKLRDEHSSELIRAFQQGRMFGHECDLEMIKRKEAE